MQVAEYAELQELFQHLNVLRSEMLELEASGLVGCAEVHPQHAASAKNLMHYLALRRHDIRHLQSQLAALGLSSLGRTESHVMTALHTVANLLGRLTGSEEASAPPSNGTPGLGEGARLLKRNTEVLLGVAPAARNPDYGDNAAGSSCVRPRSAFRRQSSSIQYGRENRSGSMTTRLGA